MHINITINLYRSFSNRKFGLGFLFCLFYGGSHYSSPSWPWTDSLHGQAGLKKKKCFFSINKNWIVFGTQLGSAEGPCLCVLGSWPQLLPETLVKEHRRWGDWRWERQNREKMASPWRLSPGWLNTLVSEEPSPRLGKKHGEGSGTWTSRWYHWWF